MNLERTVSNNFFHKNNITKICLEKSKQLNTVSNNFLHKNNI